MKKISSYGILNILLIATVLLLANCSKDDPVVPAFNVTAATVQLQGGGEGLQFAAKCTNDDVKMTKVIITDPLQTSPITYNLNGNYFVKNEVFALQAADEAYYKTIGTWSFNFVGNRTADGASFSVNVTLGVSK